MPPSLRDLYHAHAVEPPGMAVSLSEPPATPVLSMSPTYARLPPLFRPSTASPTAALTALTAPMAPMAPMAPASGYLRLPEINMLREPPAPLTAGYANPMPTAHPEPTALIRTPVSEAGSRSMERSAAAIAAHTAAAQRSVANSGQPKFVVMTGPAIDNSATTSSTITTSSPPTGSDARTPSRRGSQGRSSIKRTTPRKPISSAAKAAAARAEMLANVSYTIDKADGTSMTFSRRNVSETFDISPAALQASQPRSVPPPPTLPVPPALHAAFPMSMPLDDPQESLVLPPIVNSPPSSSFSSSATDTPHIRTLQPVSKPGPGPSLLQTSPVITRPAHIVFPLVVPERSASSPASPCHASSSYTPLPTMKRRSSLNLMSLPAALSSLEPVGSSSGGGSGSGGEAKRFLLPDHEPRMKPQVATRTSYGFQMETFQRTSRKQYQQQRHRMHQQRYRQRQQEQQQQKRQQQVQQHQEGRQRQWEVPLGQPPAPQSQPQSQPHQESQPLSSTPPAPHIPSHQPQLPSDNQPPLTHHHHHHQPLLSTPDSPLLYRRSALPPQVLGGEVSLDDMPRVHIVHIPGQSFPAPLPRGNVPGFLLLPAEKDAADWLVGKGGTGGDLWEDSLSSGTCAGITYPLVSEAEARKVNGEVSAVVAASGSHNGIPDNLLCRAMDGTGDARLTRSALRTLRRLACPATSQMLPIHEYEYEVTARSIALAICILIRPQAEQGQEGASPHALDLCPLHSTEADDETDCQLTNLVGGRALMPTIVGSRLAEDVAAVTDAGTDRSTSTSTNTLAPGQGLEVPRLTIILSSNWSTWTASCTAVDMSTGSCVQTHGDLPQLDHFDPRIPPGSRLRLVQRGTCRHRHVDSGTRVQRRLVLTRVARGMQANLVVEERIFFLTGTGDGEATGQPRGVLVVFSTAYFLQSNKN